MPTLNRSRIAASAAFTLLLAAFGPGAALAHDTWLEVRSAPPGQVALALTTGAIFPKSESGTPADALRERGCIDAAGREAPLRAVRESPAALSLQAPVRPSQPLVACWVQTMEFEVEVSPALVPTYLREIAAPPATHAAWAEQQRQGLPWRERYTKHARITLAWPSAAPATASTPLALDIEIETAGGPQVGQPLQFRVWRDGQPLADQAVELRSDMSPLGLWRRTDAEGRASVPVPFAGRWVLRATDLRPEPGAPGRWVSRFVTHTFAVAAPVAGATQPSKPWMPNARSTNQTSANTTMASEPPTSTTRR
jgi:uncharacterized GH25 family protein